MKIEKENVVECVTTSGEKVEGRLVRIGRFDAVFALSDLLGVLRASESLASLKITAERGVIYEGRAIVRNLVDTHTGLLCEVTLSEEGVNLQALPVLEEETYDSFARQWLAAHQIAPEIKVAVTDMTIYCDNLRSWMNQLEVAGSAANLENAAAQEEEFLGRVVPRIVESVNAQHERFEELAGRISPERRGIHQAYIRREWSPYYLCAPFGHRTYHKPLGYAGDYEMMNMILRKTFEGKTLYAKAIHYWLVSQWPAESVRNRILHLQQNLVAETARVVRAGGRARMLNLGCGPAWEVQHFLKDTSLSNDADFVLLDFNEETLSYTGRVLAELKKIYGRKATFEMRQSTVQQLLRAALQRKSIAEGERFDFIYCAGLFDYLSDATCKAIVNLFFEWLRPGGLVLVANMNDSKPFRHMVEFLLDWHLIYRDSRFMASLIPNQPGASGSVITESTTVNLFTHVRKAASS